MLVELCFYLVGTVAIIFLATLVIGFNLGYFLAGGFFGSMSFIILILFKDLQTETELYKEKEKE